MLYVTFPTDVHFDATTPPVNTNVLWVVTIPVGKLAITTDFTLPETRQKYIGGTSLSIPIYQFDADPVIKQWSEIDNCWTEIVFNALVSRDNYMLQDSNQLYLTVKEKK